jgi:penicillin amidase
MRKPLSVYGLTQPVTVLRDRWGVAHIYAQNQDGLFFAAGLIDLLVFNPWICE